MKRCDIINIKYICVYYTQRIYKINVQDSIPYSISRKNVEIISLVKGRRYIFAGKDIHRTKSIDTIRSQKTHREKKRDPLKNTMPYERVYIFG